MSRRLLAGFLAFLQIALSFTLSGYAAAGQIVVSKQTSAAPVRLTVLSAMGRLSVGVPSTLRLNALTGLSGGTAVTKGPQVQSRDLSQAGQALPASEAATAAASTLLEGITGKPAVQAAQARDIEARVQESAARVNESLSLPGLREQAPSESSRGAAEKVFAQMRGEKLISSSDGEVAVPAVGVKPGLTTTRERALEKPQAGRGSLAEAQVPQVQAPALKRVFWKQPAVKRAAAAVSLAGLAVAAPWLAAHVGLVATVGSLTLGIIGVPQIVRILRDGRESVKDLTVASPLIWFAAATLLSVVSVGQGSDWKWSAVNLLGVLQSGGVVGLINYFKRDPKALKATVLTVAATLAPLPFIVLQLFMPLSAWVSVSFAAAMGLLVVLSWPQIEQNYRIFKAEGRPPQGIAPLYPALLVFGSLLHLFAAIMGPDIRWAMNAISAIVSGSTVLGQIYAPRLANALVGPLVKVEDKVKAAFVKFKELFKPDMAALLPKARAALSDIFDNDEYLGYAGKDTEGQLAQLRRRAAALPGRSIIYLEAPTGAGKSTLAKNLQEVLGDRFKVFPVDRYFKSRGEVPTGTDGLPDFDRLGALHVDRVVADIKDALAAKKVELPAHDMKTETYIPYSGEFLELGPNDILVVDSIYAAHGQLLDAGSGHASLNVFLYAPAVMRLARRVVRDRKERGMSAEKNLKGWAHILYDEKEFILPLHDRADLLMNLASADELNGLQEKYAGLLAEEWLEHGQRSGMTELFRANIAASLAADRESFGAIMGAAATPK